MKLLPLVFLIAATSAAWADSPPAIAGTDPYIAVPGAAMMPNKATLYRAVFDARHGGAKPTELAPAINLAGSELNTIAGAGVSLKQARFAIVFHTQPADDALLDNPHYKAKFGVDNPNLKVLAALRKAGVELMVCGQQLVADKVDPKWISRDVTIVEDGLIALMVYQNRGYAILQF